MSSRVRLVAVAVAVTLAAETVCEREEEGEEKVVVTVESRACLVPARRNIKEETG